MNKGIKRLFVVVSLIVLVMMSGYAGPAFGQAETGTIGGTVSDSTGAVIPNAKVIVKSVSTGGERPTATDDRGNYTVSNLQPGLYSVIVEAANLAKKEIRAEVTVGSRVEVNFTLTVGVSSTVIEVIGEGGVQVNTETATIGTVMDSQAIQQLPTVNRNPYTFAQYVGTASDGDPSARGVGVAFNGLRSSGTNVLLDGAANNNEFTASTGQAIPLDSVQEYSVLTNNFTAEYGRASSAVVNLATKSGSNQFHGSAYEFNRVSAMATESAYDKAQDPINPKQTYVRNQFGGSVGGPIKKDKLFFFGNSEWNRIRSSSVQNNYVIDPAFVALAAPSTQNYFQQLGTLRPGARVTSVVPFGVDCTAPDQGTLAYNNANELNSCGTVPEGTAFLDKVNYSVPADAGAGSPQNQLLVVGRVDWNISDSTQLYGRYALNKADLFAGTVSNSAYEGYDTGENIMQNNFLLSVTHSFGPRWTMQNKVVFNRLNDFQPLGTAPISPGLYFNPTTTTKFGGVSVMLPGYLPTTPGNGIPFGGPQNFLQFYQDWSHTVGRHTLRFGGSYDYQRDNRTFGAYETPVGAFSKSGGIAAASVNRFLGGYWGQFQGAIYPQGKFPCPFPITAGVPCTDPETDTVYDPGNVTTPVAQPVFARSNRYQEFGLYITDSWKATTRLTLTLGLRYDFFGTQHNKNPQLDSNYYFNGGGSDFYQEIRNGEVQLAPDSKNGRLWDPSYKNFGPKVGFAYDLFGTGKTVIRGGYSISYERNFGNVTFNVIQNPPNYAVVSLQDGVDVPVGNQTVTTDPAGPLAGSGTVKALPKVSLRAVNPNIKQAYAELYSLTLEHEFQHNLLFGFDYSGSRGLHLYDIANINQAGGGVIYGGDNPDDVGLSRLKQAQYSNINFRGSNGISKYNALVARVQMNSFQKTGLTLNANYTYGHTSDELSDTFSSSGNQYNLGYLNPFNPSIDYGNSYLDIRSRFSMSAVWEVPLGKDMHGFAKQVVNGWTIAPLLLFETGTPFSIFDCTNAVTECMYAVNAPGTAGLPKGAPSTLVPVGGADFIYTPFSNSAGSLVDSTYCNPQLLSVTCVSDFGPFPSGMTGRNSFRGPGFWNVDLGIYKTFSIGERFKLQFRGEMYNVFNHANLYAQTGSGEVEGPYVDATKSLHPDGVTKDTRTVQLALRLTF